MQFETLSLDKEQDLAVITLNRPERKNALNLQMLEDLQAAVTAVADDSDIRVVILTGGDKFFCAGADISMLGEFPTWIKQFHFSCNKLSVQNLARLRKPTVAAVAGYALGGGCELAIACDLRIAATTALFGMPELNLGMIPGLGGTQRLPRLLGTARAKEMIFTGEVVSADEAYRIGLVNKVVPLENLMSEARGLAQKLASKAPVALQMAKLAIDSGSKVDLESALLYEAQTSALLFETRDRTEGINAFLEKRKPLFSGE